MSSFFFGILDTGYGGLEPQAPVWVKVTGVRAMLTRCNFKFSQLWSILRTKLNNWSRTG